MRHALAAVLLLTTSAAADGIEIKYAKPQWLTASLDGDVARFAVRYQVPAPSVDDEEAINYNLPVNGLVIGATVTDRRGRHVLDLVTAEKARDELDVLYKRKPSRDRRIAVMIDAQAMPDTFSITTLAQTSLATDVTISAPTCFYRDARYLEVPTEWLPHIALEQRVPDSQAPAVSDACSLRDHVSDAQAWMKFSSPGLAAKRAGAARIGSYANRAALGKTQIVKLELNLAARMTEVPADLATVLVVDTSRSMEPAELDAQRETIEAYLRATPNGRVQVIAYSRRARALLPSWMTTGQAKSRIDRELRGLVRRNGSNIEEGLREAGRWLDQIKGTRRIVLFTDEILSMRSEHTRVIDDAIPKDTVVHVVTLGGANFMRDDEASLARIAAQTRGISVRGGEHETDGETETPLDATLLARPITLDHVVLETPGWKALGGTRMHDCPDDSTIEDLRTLAEGASCTWWGQSDRTSAPITVEGFLWGERVVRVLRADQSRSQEVIREVSAMKVLEEDLQKLAEKAARAVNAAWSLFASWGGEGGYEDFPLYGGFGFGMSCSHCGHPDGIGGFGHGFLGPGPDLESQFARIAMTCKPDKPVDIEVETTLEEIVDVDVRASTLETRTCVEEALWNAWVVAPGAHSRTITKLRVKSV